MKRTHGTQSTSSQLDFHEKLKRSRLRSSSSEDTFTGRTQGLKILIILMSVLH